VRYHHKLVGKIFLNLILEFIQDLVNLVPINIRIFSGLLSIGLVVWEDILSPILVSIRAKNNITILCRESSLEGSNGSQDHMAKQVLFEYRGLLDVEGLHHIREDNLIQIY
jgi:hypothetical protein